MKLKRLSLRAAVASMIVTTATVASIGPVHAANKTMRVAYIISNQHPMVPAGLDHIIETVKQADDSISFRTFPSGQLGKAGDSIKMLQNGLADISLIVVPYHRQELPMS